MGSYNGWSNHETWLVNLWLTNDEFNYRETESLAKKIWDRTVSNQYLTRRELAGRELAKKIKEDIEEFMPDLAGMWSDLMRSALDSVDFDEIAANWLSEFDDDEIEAETETVSD